MGIGQDFGKQRISTTGFGRYINTDLGEYLVPVNADIPDIDVAFVGLPDPAPAFWAQKAPVRSGSSALPLPLQMPFTTATGCRARALPIQFDKLNYEG